MGIRIEHQPSPVAVGLAAWQTGQGAAKERQQKYALNLMAQDRQIRAQREQQFGDRMTKGFGAAVAGLPQIPEYADAETANRLGKLKQGMGIMASGVHGYGQQVQGQMQGAWEKYNEIVGGIQKPDAAQQAQDQTLYFDDNDGQWHRESAPGRRPFFDGREMPPNPQQQQAAKQQQDEQKKLEDESKANKAQAESNRTRAVTRSQKLLEKYIADTGDESKTYLDFLTQADEDIRKENEHYNPPAPSQVTADPSGNIVPVQPTEAEQSPSATPTQPAAPPTPAAAASPASSGAVSDEDWDAGAPVEFSNSGGFFSIEDTQNLGGLDKGIESDFSQMLNREQDTIPTTVPTMPNQPQAAVPWGNAQPAPREIGEVQGLPAEQLRQFRLGAERPSTRTALEQKYGMEFKPIDEIYGDAPQVERPPVHSIEQEHVTAQTAPRMGQPDPARVGQLHERVSAIPNKAVADRTRGTAAGAASDRALGMTPMQRTMGGISTQPHVSQQRQAEIQAVRDMTSQSSQQGDKTARQQAIDERVPGAMARMAERRVAADLGDTQAAQYRKEATTPEEIALEQRAAESMKRSEEALARSRALPPRKYHVPQATEARTNRLAREDASKKMRQARGIAKGNARKAQLGKPPADFRQVSGPEQVATLPMGTYYILPDGKIRQKRTQ